MGQKVNPIGFRLGYNKRWSSRWTVEKGKFAEALKEDLQIRKFILKKMEFSGVPTLDIERTTDKVTIFLHTSRPGVVIGRRGSELEKLKEEIKKKTGREVEIKVQAIKNPDLNAQLVAENIALQLKRRISFRRALKRAMQITMQNGAQGVKLKISGRIGGHEIARSEGYSQGRVPLHTLRANIDYGFSESKTSYGLIGCKVWICLGEATSMEVEKKEEKNGLNA